MTKVQVLDPAMCCPAGVCGPEVDPALVCFAADLEWLKTNGVEVERFNLSQSPAAFVANAEVTAAMRARDDELIASAQRNGCTTCHGTVTGDMSHPAHRCARRAKVHLERRAQPNASTWRAH